MYKAKSLHTLSPIFFRQPELTILKLIDLKNTEKAFLDVLFFYSKNTKYSQFQFAIENKPINLHKHIIYQMKDLLKKNIIIYKLITSRNCLKHYNQNKNTNNPFF